MVAPAIVVPAAAPMAPGRMSGVAATGPGCEGHPGMGMGEQPTPNGHVRVGPVTVIGVGLAEGDPAQRQQRRQGCQKELAPLLSRRSSVHCFSGGSQEPTIRVGPDPNRPTGQ